MSLRISPLRGMWLSIAEGGGKRTSLDLDAGLRFSLKGLAGEVMVTESLFRRKGNPPSRCEPVESSTEDLTEPADGFLRKG